MSESRFHEKSGRIPENIDLTDEQRLFLIENALMRTQMVLTNHYGSAGYLGICVNSGAHPGVTHPHWDWDYLTSLKQVKEKNDVAEYRYDEVALWCSVGGHAFAPNDPGRQRLNLDTWDEDGNAASMHGLACGEHATRAVAPKTRPAKQLTSAPVQEGKYLVDAEEYERYIKKLEAENLDTPITGVVE